MNRVQENQLSMFLSVEKVLQDNSTVWNSVPVMVTAVGNFTANLVALRKAIDAQAKPITGYAKDKRKALLDMVEKALEVRAAIFAYADTLDNNTLKDRVKYSRSKLTYSSDTLSAEFVQVIKDEGQALGTALNPYGIGNTKLTQLQQSIDAYLALVPSTRVAITSRKLATKKLRDGFSGTSKLLTERLDKLMFRFKQNFPDFFTQYFDARIIIDLKQTAPNANNPPVGPTTQ